MCRCDIYSALETTVGAIFSDAVSFSIMGCILSEKFDGKIGLVFGAYTGLLSRFIRPFMATILTTDQEGCNTSKIAALVVEYVAEVGLATYLTTKSYQPISLYQAGFIFLAPFFMRSLFEDKNSFPTDSHNNHDLSLLSYDSLGRTDRTYTNASTSHPSASSSAPHASTTISDGDNLA